MHLSGFTGSADPTDPPDFVLCHREAYKGMADPGDPPEAVISSDSLIQWCIE